MAQDALQLIRDGLGQTGAIGSRRNPIRWHLARTWWFGRFFRRPERLPDQSSHERNAGSRGRFDADGALLQRPETGRDAENTWRQRVPASVLVLRSFENTAIFWNFGRFPAFPQIRETPSGSLGMG